MTRELDSRFVDGIDVRLLWDSATGRVVVDVRDAKTGDAFELVVPDGADALEVFHHPYAFADSLGATGRRQRARLAA